MATPERSGGPAWLPRLPLGRRHQVSEVPDDFLPMAVAGSIEAVAGHLRRWRDREAEADWGMSGPRVFLVAMLSRLPSLTMGEVAELLDVTPRAVTRLVDGLEAEGYVTRTRDPDDKRVVHVACTPLAVERARTTFPQHHARVLALFADLPPSALRPVLEAMVILGERLRTDLGEAAPPAVGPPPPLGPPGFVPGPPAEHG